MSPPTQSPAGARWIRAALQVNPFAYKGKNSPSKKFANEEAYNAALLSACRDENIQLIAVTDHWNVDTSAGLIEGANRAGVVALPGFEANSSEGIHLLVIFERASDFSSVNAAIGLCGAIPGSPNGTTGASYQDILQKMADQGALVIPAHANVPSSGMLTGRMGNPLVRMILNPHLHAIGITPGTPETKDQKAILAGTKPFDRTHALAVVHADDVCHPDTLKDAGATCWFKVSSPCLESLRLAVRTPATRVGVANPDSRPRSVIREISWIGGFLDGVTLPLADDLTTLIGGRGTGKSTVIESLRYALGIEPIGEKAKEDHKGVVARVLRSGTTVRLVVDAVTPTAGRFTIERSVPNLPVVHDSSDTATSQKPADVIGQVEIFGQHELAELAHDKVGVARMLERFSGHTEPDPDHAVLLRHLEENREKLSRIESDRAGLEEELAEIPRLQEQVDRFQQTNLPARLEEQKRLAQDEAVFAESNSRLVQARESVDGLRGDELVEALLAEIENIEGSTQATTLARVSAAMRKLGETVQATLGALDKAILSAETEVKQARRTGKH